MFGKTDSNNLVTPTSSPAPAEQQTQPQASSTPQTQSASTGSNFISKDVSINGKIKLAGDITIDGTLIGEITSKGVVSISNNANIKANIFASSIIVSGKVDGNLSATDRLEILQNANVKGDIKTAILKVDPGATFTGSCQVGPTVKVAEPSATAAPTKTSAPAQKPAASPQPAKAS